MKFKIFLLLLVTLGIFNSYSQDAFLPREIPLKYSPQSVNYKMAGKGFSFDKFSVGIKGGINFSIVIPLSRSTIFSGQDPAGYEKDYNFFTQKNLFAIE